MGRTHRPQVALYLDADKVEQLHNLAGRTGETQQALLRQAVDVLLKDYNWVRERAEAKSARRAQRLRRKLADRPDRSA